MKIKPVKSYKKPGYPTREDFLSNSSYLSEYIPDKWKRNKIVATALAVYIFGANNSNAQTFGNTKESFVTMNNNLNKKENDIKKKSVEEKLTPSIAPIFIHGDGRGSTGCMVMNPPVFLSEEEARQVVESELMKEHIVFDKKNMKLNEVVFQSDYGFQSVDKDAVTLDGFSSKYNLGYEVVTERDYGKFVDDRNLSTVQSFDFVKAAENLREKMKDYGKMNTVIFYDPLERYEYTDNKNSAYEEILRKEQEIENDAKGGSRHYQKIDKSKSIELLKCQVQDFIEWIKKEGLLQEK